MNVEAPDSLKINQSIIELVSSEFTSQQAFEYIFSHPKLYDLNEVGLVFIVALPMDVLGAILEKVTS